MVQPNEIRVNNWYFKGGYKWRHEVDSMATVFYNLHEITPIPLTPEILEKAGFKSSPGSEYYKHENLCVLSPIMCCLSDAGLDIIVDDEAGYYICRGIQFLHQLQNLYFSLVGEELKIDL